MRYRASPTVCNACPVKSTCTTSQQGRQIGRNVDPWPASEAERFHRGIACAVAVLAVVWPLAMMVERRAPAELVVLGGAVVLVALGSWPLWSHLRRSPAGFPLAVKVETLDETVAGRATVAPPIRYRSDRRHPEPPDEQPPAPPRSRRRN